jgi:hypothetical protein
MSDHFSPQGWPHEDAFALPVTPTEIPVAAPINVEGQPTDVDEPLIPGADPAPIPPSIPPGPGLPPVPTPPFPPIPPFPQIKWCNLGFRDGCYAVTVRPTGSLRSLVGTLRVDRGAPGAGPDGVIVSGDLYRGLLPWPVHPGLPMAARSTDPDVASGDSDAGDASAQPGSVAAAVSSAALPIPLPLRRIPIYPRSRYHSYLKGTRLSAPLFTFGSRPCQVVIDADQFDYTQPTVGSHQGSFLSSASRTLRFVLQRVPPSLPFFGGPRFEGRMYEGVVDKGSVALTWVSSYLRRAVLEIDTLQGAVAPAPVPNSSGTGTEYFDTVFAGARWQLTVEEDQINVPVPTGVNANICWSSADLHNLMSSVRKPTTNLDAEWRTHLIVVPATMGCSRGVMYDQIAVPREGSASFSDDGYPSSHSANFGTAENQTQRNVPRAFLRSATHEVTHAFNQIHQESETSADNSIMTTTPSVADVLGGPATGEPGVFPDQINLAVNTTVRNHLAHMPDPVVRPGGWPFASWFPSGAPQASDRELFDASELSLVVTVDSARAPLGAPVEVTWTLTNNTEVDLIVPNDIRLEGLFATMTVDDDRGATRPVRPFVIECEAVRLEPLGPGEQRTASYRVFWSSDGFAFEHPGRHIVTVCVAWSAGGVPVGVVGNTEIWVDHPLNDAENRDASLVMNPEVGKWVALGGGAYHLTEAVDRLATLASGDAQAEVSSADAGAERSRVAAAFDDLLPKAKKIRAAAESAGAPARRSRKSTAKKKAAKAVKKKGN